MIPCRYFVSLVICPGVCSVLFIKNTFYIFVLFHKVLQITYGPVRGSIVYDYNFVVAGVLYNAIDAFCRMLDPVVRYCDD